MAKRVVLSEKMLDMVMGGVLLDPVSGYKGDYQQIMDTMAKICGDWIYDEFAKNGAAGVKAALVKKYGAKIWFVKRFPVYDANGNLVEA